MQPKYGRIFFAILQHSAEAAARDARGLSIPEIFFSPDFFFKYGHDPEF